LPLSRGDYRGRPVHAAVAARGAAVRTPPRGGAAPDPGVDVLERTTRRHGEPQIAAAGTPGRVADRTRARTGTRDVRRPSHSRCEGSRGLADGQDTCGRLARLGSD